MSLIWAYHAYVDAFLQESFFPDFQDILLQRFHRLPRLFGILLAQAVIALSTNVLFRRGDVGVYPLYCTIPIQYAAVLHARVAPQLTAIKLMIRELHDGICHPVLHSQQAYGFGLLLHDLLHQGVVQSASHRLGTFYCGRQLTMIAGQNDAVGFLNSYPTGCFHGLGCLVDE